MLLSLQHLPINIYCGGSMLNLGLILSLFLALVSSCAQPITSETKLVNSRSQWKMMTAMIELETPPLLATSRLDENGKRVLDVTQKDALLAEQERVIGRLQAMSTDIRVVYRYNMVFNGLALYMPKALIAEVESISNILAFRREALFSLPKIQEGKITEAPEDPGDQIGDATSVSFINGKKVHDTLKMHTADGNEIAVRGTGVRVAIVDTGIDYYHKMFNGSGVVADYRKDDPALVEEGTFPTAKVVAGIDLVGSKYNPSASKLEDRIPTPDADPLDEQGHGTHVAGTVAGLGDKVNTYDGVAPDASLYAIKVFGVGATGESVIIKALDYAVDPNGDYVLDDQAHVVNMSLGSAFGSTPSMYSSVIDLLTDNGTLVVCSAGNSGGVDFIVGSPSTVASALSVAASVDNSDHNWKKLGLKFVLNENEELLAEAAEGDVGKPIREVEPFTSTMYYIGLADKDLTEEQKTNLQGKVALIDRGLVRFDVKVGRAEEAGAIGVVVVNNVPGEPFAMGGVKRYTIPALMIGMQEGNKVKVRLESEAVTVTFDSSVVIARPDLIDTLTNFSSIGPRSLDSHLKPEVSAPGLSITSARVGSGDKSFRASGTSMSAPHISGVAALVRQYRPTISAATLKGTILASTKDMHRKEGGRYAVWQQGSGRVDAYAAVTAEVVFSPSTLSLGQTTVAKRKKIAGSFELLNLTGARKFYSLKVEADPHLQFSLPASVSLAAGGSERIDYSLMIDVRSVSAAYSNFDGYVGVYDRDGKRVARMPLLLGVKKFSRVAVSDAKVYASSPEDSRGALVDITLHNKGESDGEAYLFNLLSLADRKEVAPDGSAMPCDIQSAGYRLVQQKVGTETLDVLEFAAKFYHPVTTWHHCVVSVQFDADGDDVAEQELVGGMAAPYFHERGPLNSFTSVLADAAIVREMRAKYEASPMATENYLKAIVSTLPMTKRHNHSTLLIAAVDLAKVEKTATGGVNFKMMSLNPFADYRRSDDQLVAENDGWQFMIPTVGEAAYTGMPAVIEVAAGSTVDISLVKGGDYEGSLIAYFPDNSTTVSRSRLDHQSAVIDVGSVYFRP